MWASVIFVICIVLGCATASEQNIWQQNQGKATELRYEDERIEFIEEFLKDNKLGYFRITDKFNEFLEPQKGSASRTSADSEFRQSANDDPLLTLLEGLKFQHKGKN